MIETILTAAVLGFLAGAVPGPYTTVVASRAFEKGFRSALKLAFIPVVTEIPPLIATSFVLKRLNHDLLGAVGVIGGAALAWLGVRFYRRQGDEWEESDREEQHTFGAMAVAGLLSPAPWIFWLVAAGPLFIRAWNHSPVRGILFAGILFAMLIGTAAGIAWLASHGRSVVRPEVRKRVVRVVGVVLVAAGGVLAWQSLAGNFQSLIQRQEELRERVQ